MEAQKSTGMLFQTGGKRSGVARSQGCVDRFGMSGKAGMERKVAFQSSEYIDLCL